MKSIVILSILLLSSLLTSAINNGSDYIRIEYVGDADTARQTIFISENRVPDQQDRGTIPYDLDTFPFFVYNDELVFIEKAINSTLTKPFEETDYNGFKITVQENNSTVSYFINRKDSNLLFLKINAYLETHNGNKDLILAITDPISSNVLPTNAAKSDNDYVRIEYVGDADAPMPTLFISENQTPDQQWIMTIGYNSVPTTYLVYNNELIFIEKAVSTALTKTFEEKDYNGFKITLRENNSTVSNFITRKDSNSLFLEISAYLETHRGNKNLAFAIAGLRLQNVFPR